jgi:hypothetical protein
VDLIKAYDKVWRPGLLECMENKGLGGKPLRIVRNLYQEHWKNINTVGGDTGWIKTGKGLKQGCVLSPILFALYIADIGEILAKEGEGVSLGGVNISALFFADDMVLIARSEQALKNEIRILQDLTESKRLEINYSKTEIMKMGPNTQQEKVWLLTDSRGRTKGIVTETRVYKYLGIKLGKNRRFLYHEQDIINSINKRVGLTKAQAGEATDTTWVAEVIWEKVMKPGLLHGAEVVKYSKTTINKIESAQKSVAKWICGASRRASGCGVIGELGWYSIHGEIAKRKVAYWGRLIRMGQERWAKKALNSILEGKTKSEWREEVQEACCWLGDTWEWLEDTNWKEKLYDRWRSLEEAKWREEKSQKGSMQNYSKERLLGREEYLDGTGESKTLCKMRIGDIGEFTDREKTIQVCHKCKDNTDNLARHILLECKAPEVQNTATTLRMKVANNTKEVSVTRILKDKSKSNQMEVWTIYKAWEIKDLTEKED